MAKNENAQTDWEMNSEEHVKMASLCLQDDEPEEAYVHALFAILKELRDINENLERLVRAVDRP